MVERSPLAHFDEERAASYDKTFEKLAPMKDALHLLTRLILLDLPAEARVLCVGAGTGAELSYLAAAFPAWSFTVVEPSVPMLDICRARAEDQGIASRCTFHADFLATLLPSAPFDAATAILVSQFLTDPDERRAFFRQIAGRLRPGGVLVAADLSGKMSDPRYEEQLALWLRAMGYSGMPADKLVGYRARFGHTVAVLPRDQIEAMMMDAGFGEPTLFYQALFICAWHARVAR